MDFAMPMARAVGEESERETKVRVHRGSRPPRATCADPVERAPVAAVIQRTESCLGSDCPLLTGVGVTVA
jgi:hypothetical protein